MAIARLLQCGFEFDYEELLSLFPYASVTPPAVSPVFKYTGGYSLASTSNVEGRYTTPSYGTLTQCRMGCMMRCLGAVAGDSPDIFGVLSGTTQIVTLRYDGDNTQLEVLCGATEVGTYSIDLSDEAWRQFGMDVKIDGAAGWISVYVDGTEVINFDGDTNDGGANFNAFFIGSLTDGQNWEATMYMDDVYWDSTTGEGAPACPPLLRFFSHKPTGSGNYSDWLGSDGDSVNNYLHIDDLHSVSTADYVEHDTTTEADTYTTTYSDEDVPPGAVIQAVIPTAYARKDDGATALQLKLMTRESAVDDVGAAQALTVDYEIYWERFLLDPSSAAWTKTTVDAMEIGLYVE